MGNGVSLNMLAHSVKGYPTCMFLLGSLLYSGVMGRSWASHLGRDAFENVRPALNLEASGRAQANLDPADIRERVIEGQETEAIEALVGVLPLSLHILGCC